MAWRVKILNEIAACRLAEIRRAQRRTKAEVAQAMGGRLRLVAEFGDQVIPLR